jgi:hypothetical protein
MFVEKMLTGASGFEDVEFETNPQKLPLQGREVSVGVMLVWAPNTFSDPELGEVAVGAVTVFAGAGVLSPAMYAAGSVGVTLPVRFVPGAVPVHPHAPTSSTMKRHVMTPGLYIFYFHLL